MKGSTRAGQVKYYRLWHLCQEILRWLHLIHGSARFYPYLLDYRKVSCQLVYSHLKGALYFGGFIGFETVDFRCFKVAIPSKLDPFASQEIRSFSLYLRQKDNLRVLSPFQCL